MYLATSHREWSKFKVNFWALPTDPPIYHQFILYRNPESYYPSSFANEKTKATKNLAIYDCTANKSNLDIQPESAYL